MSFVEFVKMLNYLSPAILLIGIGIGYGLFKKLDAVNKWIVFYLSAMLATDLISRVIVQFIQHNLIMLPAYSLTELILFLMVYKLYLFKRSHKVLTAISIAGVAYIVWEIAIHFIFNSVDIRQFQPYAKVVDNFIIISCALAFFHEKINIFKDSKWHYFRFNAVVLVYFSLNMLFFLPFNFLINETTGLKFYFWLSNLIITVLFYLFLIHSIWKNGKTQKLLPSGLR